jgi:hypothetical protein
MKQRRAAVAFVAVLFCAAGGWAAQEEAAPAMSADEKAMMEAMEKAATPGKQHQWLASLAGSWEFTARFYMDPGAPPSESKGTAERQVKLGGRVLAETVKGEFMGQAFEGFGLTGYDNVTGSYWGTWTDNMSTGLMLSKGTCDEQGSCAYTGEMTDPMTGQTKTSRMVSKHTGASEHHEFWETRDGKEVKTMELEYKRKM